MADDETSVAILDDQGRLVVDLPIASGQKTVSWDGTTADGQFVLAGGYTADLIRQVDGSVIENAVSTAWTVREVQFASNDVMLELSDGTALSYNEITNIR